MKNPIDNGSSPLCYYMCVALDRHRAEIWFDRRTSEMENQFHVQRGEMWPTGGRPEQRTHPPSTSNESNNFRCTCDPFSPTFSRLCKMSRAPKNCCSLKYLSKKYNLSTRENTSTTSSFDTTQSASCFVRWLRDFHQRFLLSHFLGIGLCVYKYIVYSVSILPSSSFNATNSFLFVNRYFIHGQKSKTFHMQRRPKSKYE